MYFLIYFMMNNAKSRQEKELEISDLISKSPVFRDKFQEKIPMELDKFMELVPKMPDDLFDELYAVLILEGGSSYN